MVVVVPENSEEAPALGPSFGRLDSSLAEADRWAKFAAVVRNLAS